MRLRPHGAGRFVSAAFLSVWLCGWAIGEAIVGWIVGKGIHALMTGEPLSRDGSTPAAGVLLIAGAFVATWLVFWTIGGVMAMREWCRLLMGEDRLLAGPDGLTVEHRYGPFRSRQTFARDAIRHLDRALAPRPPADRDHHRHARALDARHPRVSTCRRRRRSSAS